MGLRIMSSASKALARVRKSRARVDRTWFREWRAWIAGGNHWPRPGSLVPRNKGFRNESFSLGVNEPIALVHLVNAISSLPNEMKIDHTFSL
jgi:hypothetical protein